MKNRLSGIKIMVGLGNPGPEYKNTFHNAGQLMLDYVAEKNKLEGTTIGKWSRHGRAQNAFESCKTNNLNLIKPLNYMNENGKVVRSAVKTFGAKPDSLVVAHDDSDIEVGNYKISFGRGAAGHRGVESVIESLGTKNFWRLRIGIRLSQRKSASRAKAGDFVLKKISPDDKKTMLAVLEKAWGEISSSTRTI